MKKIVLLFFVVFLINSKNANAGPPFDTDDPVPVELRTWELYLSSHSRFNKTFGEGTLPHFEVNYGVFKNAQLHLIVPAAYSSVHGEKTNYGIGDVEVGMKYRFIEETKYCPQIGVFPLCEIPTGKVEKELGNGKTQILLPVWLQKSFGEKWQAYGGYGYWVHPDNGKLNSNFAGMQVQYKVCEKFSLGAEVFDEIPVDKELESVQKFNVGGIIDLSPKSHIIFSAGRSFSQETLFQYYVGYMFSLSKEEPSMNDKHNLLE
ncbi:MAG: transporter [Bacteroidetes bacterium]|jgi:hypothetical protein|nr:transporter [Bacteroidota bacterium]